MLSPVDAVHDLIGRSQAVQSEQQRLLIYLAETLVEVQYTLKGTGDDAEKLAAIEIHVRDMLRRITHTQQG